MVTSSQSWLDEFKASVRIRVEMVVTPSRVRPVSISSVDYFGTGLGGVAFFRFFRDLSGDVFYARSRRFAELFVVGMGGVVFSLAMCFTRGDSLKDSVKV